LRPDCRGFAQGIAAALPYREAKRERPTRRAAAFVALRPDGAVLLRQRPLEGLLGGMLETPSSPWVEARPNGKALSGFAPLKAEWRKLPGVVEHSFTHFHLELVVYRADVGLAAKPKRAAAPELCGFVARADLARAALPSLMRKVLAHAFAGEAGDDKRNRQSALGRKSGARPISSFRRKPESRE
jgi:A/G-specific adenine glycosylase